MSAPCLVTVGVHCANLLGLFWVVVWNVCWYLSLKWTTGSDRKGGSQTSFKCHFTKHIAEHSAEETLCYRWFSRWKHPTLCKIKLETCLPFEHCTCAICTVRCIWTQILASHYTVSSLYQSKYCQNINFGKTDQRVHMRWSSVVGWCVCQTCLSCGCLIIWVCRRMTKPPRAK